MLGVLWLFGARIKNGKQELGVRRGVRVQRSGLASSHNQSRQQTCTAKQRPQLRLALCEIGGYLSMTSRIFLSTFSIVLLVGCAAPAYKAPESGDTAKVTLMYDGGGALGSASNFYFLPGDVSNCKTEQRMGVIDYGNPLVATEIEEFYVIPAGVPVTIDARIWPHGAPYQGFPCEATVYFTPEKGQHYYFRPEYRGSSEGCTATLTTMEGGVQANVEFRLIRSCRK